MPAAIVSLQKYNSFGGGRGQKKPFFMARLDGWGGDQNSQTCKWSVDGGELLLRAKKGYEDGVRGERSQLIALQRQSPFPPTHPFPPVVRKYSIV